MTGLYIIIIIALVAYATVMTILYGDSMLKCDSLRRRIGRLIDETNDMYDVYEANYEEIEEN